jgi:anti-sigma factor ChrR (cupin superfamily)
MKHTLLEDEAGELAAGYALGALDRSEARAFEEHLAGGCEACAAELKDFAALVPYLALAVPEATPPADVLGKLLSHISEETRGAQQQSYEADEQQAHAPKKPSSPSDLLVIRAQEGAWTETPDRGVFVKVLFTDPAQATVTSLVRISPGARVPRHRHKGVEQCLVLEGDLRSGGQVLGAGDYNCAMPGSIHEELTSTQGTLLLIVAPESYEVLEQGDRRLS